MSRTLHKLNAKAVQSATRPGRLSDGGGLYLRISPTGSKSWGFMYNRHGKRSELGLGSFPAVSLQAARELSRQCREAIAEGRDPKETRTSTGKAAPKTFADAVADYLDSKGDEWSNKKHSQQWRMTLGPAYCASILDRSVADIELDAIAELLRPIWTTKSETASRLRARLEHVFAFAIVKGWRPAPNPAVWKGGLQHLLPKQRQEVQHHSALAVSDMPEFMERLATREALAARALEFTILTCARSGEVLGARWDEFDLDAGIWSIPAERMKLRKPFRIPLPADALALVRSLNERRVSDYVFLGQKLDRPLSSMSMLMLLRRLETGVTVHGFRSTFRDWVAERVFGAGDIAEKCLAHRVGGPIEVVYRRTELLAERRELLEMWSAYLRDGSEPDLARFSRMFATLQAQMLRVRA